jgi:hypothetical protein
LEAGFFVSEPKDPVRVRTGRIGALTVHSRGRTNTGPARQVFIAKLEAQVDPNRELDADERAKRVEYALRVHMTKLAIARHRPDKAVA